MLKFIDLFAGIGGIRIAFEQAGAQCVFSSEWDKFAQQTYKANFGEQPHGDIREITSDQIPDHDLLLAGFPCQPFSISGISKKNSLGHQHGFDDEKQGNLFFEIERVLRDKQPKAFFLENVKHLERHDKGNTFRVIRETLEKLDYRIFTKIVDAQYYIPQHRERIFIVGFRQDIYPDAEFQFPEIPEVRQTLLPDIIEPKVDDKYTLTNHLWKYLQDYKEKHAKQGNGFGYGLVEVKPNAVTRTLSARYYKDGSEILIAQEGKNPRRLTPRECARLMGFSDNFQIPVSDTQAYKQFGNSVVVPAVAHVAKALVETLAEMQKENTQQAEVPSLSKQAVLHSIEYELILFLRESLLTWGETNYEDFPWRKTQNPWHALIAEIMLQRTNAQQVIPAFQDFTTKYQSPEDFVKDESSNVFSTLGLHWRERYLRNLAKSLVDGKVQIPCDKKELQKLPGIGDYIASSYRSMHLDLYDRIIDSNVVRLYRRFFGFNTDGETRRKKWFIELAEKVTPEDQTKKFNYALLDFTRAICKPLPECKQCPLKSRCHYYKHDMGY